MKKNIIYTIVAIAVVVLAMVLLHGFWAALPIAICGGILIDTPGMRELGMWATVVAMDETFEDIEKLAQYCKFSDCDHEISANCAVKKALISGEINTQHYQN